MAGRELSSREHRSRPISRRKTVNAQLAAAVAELEKKLPARYTIEANGTVEESAKDLRSIATAK
jgi:hypothetical protein